VIRRQLLALYPLFLVMAPLDPALGQTPDPAIQAVIQSPELASNEAPSVSRADFKLSFDARFTNRSEAAVEVPEPDRASGAVSWITLRWVESQEPDGRWRFVFGPGMLVWQADTPFAPCKSLGPKETLEVRRVSQPLLLHKDVFAKLGPEPTVRAGLVLTCKRQDGTLQSKTVMTAPFVLGVQAR
jgi:hypothetical protein